MQDFPEYVQLLHDQEVPLPGHADGQRHQPQHAAVPRPDGRRPEDRPHRRRRLLPDRHRQARLPEPVGGRRLLAIVLGATSENARANEAQKLLNWGYTAYEAMQAVRRQPGRWSTPAGLEGQPRRPSSWAARRPIVVAVPAGTRRADQDPGGPARSAGGALHQGPGRSARSRSCSGDQPLLDVPLVALEAVEQAGVLGRAWDAMRLWIK